MFKKFICIIVIIFKFSFCITDEQSKCYADKREEVDKKVPISMGCDAIIFAAVVVPKALDYKVTQDLIVTNCLIDYLVNYECRKYSNKVPAIR
ncbi:MAG: hypothetical protein H7A23_20320 [Leptospiraceae bacterium]|nr:hypothetical protein [Leptospiraceae bacterium]MCP5496905.1 hypothetical protein [Leptospiraceae bacterium]